MSETLSLRLAREVERQLEINSKLGEGLLADLNRGMTAIAAAAREEGKPALGYVPDRDWCRCYGHYRGTNKDLLAEQRERQKLQLIAGKQNGMLSDEQYESELRQLAIDTLGTLPADVLTAELDKRGLRVEPVDETG